MTFSQRARGRMSSALRITLLIATVVSAGSVAPLLPASDGTQAPDDDEPDMVDGGGHYCGIDCLYAYLKMGGTSVNLEDLLAPSYVGSAQGSTIDELRRAADEHGTHGESMSRLTADMLRLSPYPMILHVRSNRPSDAYNHWVLFLGVENGKARILDPPKRLELMPIARVLARWDGSALVLSDNQVDQRTFLWTARATCVAFLAVACCIVLMVRYFVQRRKEQPGREPIKPVKRAAKEALIIGLAAGVVAFACHLISPDGFVLNRGAVASVVSNYYSTFAPELSAAEFHSLFSGRNVSVIDARRMQDFKRGHIEGAINIPVTASVSERERALAGVARSTPLVVYCQSTGCRWADEVANVLAADGFTDISLFRGGWEAWNSAESKTQHD